MAADAPLKMYIAVLDEVPDHMVPVLVAHAVLNAHLEFTKVVPFDGNYAYQAGDFAGMYMSWLNHSFRKVVVKVNRKEFNKISLVHAVYIGYENTVLMGNKSCAVVCPRTEYPNVIKFAKMWKPS